MSDLEDLEQNAWAQAILAERRLNGELPPGRALNPGEERETPGQQARYHHQPQFLHPNHPMLDPSAGSSGPVAMTVDQQAQYEHNIKQQVKYQQVVAHGHATPTNRARLEDYLKPNDPSAAKCQTELPNLDSGDISVGPAEAPKQLAPDESKASDGDTSGLKPQLHHVGRKLTSKFLPLMSKSESSLPSIGRGEIEKPGPLTVLTGGFAARITPQAAVMGNGNLFSSLDGALAASGQACIEPGHRIVSQHALIVDEASDGQASDSAIATVPYTPSVYNADVWLNDPRVGTVLPAFTPNETQAAQTNHDSNGETVPAPFAAQGPRQARKHADLVGEIKYMVEDILKNTSKGWADDQGVIIRQSARSWYGTFVSRIEVLEQTVLDRIDERSSALEQNLLSRALVFEQSILDRIDLLEQAMLDNNRRADAAVLLRFHQSDMTATRQRSFARDQMLQSVNDMGTRLATRLEHLEQMQFSQPDIQPESPPTNRPQAPPNSVSEPSSRRAVVKPTKTTDAGSPVKQVRRNGSRGQSLGSFDSTHSRHVSSTQSLPAISTTTFDSDAASNAPDDTTVVEDADGEDRMPLVITLEDGDLYVMPDIMRDAYSL